MTKTRPKRSRAGSKASSRKEWRQRERRGPLPTLEEALEEMLVTTPGLAANLLQTHASSMSDSEKTPELTSVQMHEMLVPGSTRKPKP